jgi:hypothetical protein
MTLLRRLRGALLCVLLGAMLPAAACSRQTLSTSPDAGTFGARPLAVRVPAALRIARAIDALSVTIDSASLAFTQVTADVAMVTGVERDVFVFPEGQPCPSVGRRGIVPGPDFALSTDTWTTKTDGIPVSGTQYVVEVRFVLFETDVPPADGWDPHIGNYKALWSRTLRQAEE